MEAGPGFFFRDGILYRWHWKPHSDPSTEVHQLVLFKQCCKSVLELAHNIPMAGHLCWKKTAERVLQRMYWPGVYRDVGDHCCCFRQCQKSSSHCVKRAPLIPLPIMDVPFKKIAIDISSPLPHSSSRKRFILIICDYTT